MEKIQGSIGNAIDDIKENAGNDLQRIDETSDDRKSGFHRKDFGTRAKKYRIQKKRQKLARRKNRGK